MSSHLREALGDSCEASIHFAHEVEAQMAQGTCMHLESTEPRMHLENTVLTPPVAPTILPTFQKEKRQKENCTTLPPGLPKGTFPGLPHSLLSYISLAVSRCKGSWEV